MGNHIANYANPYEGHKMSSRHSIDPLVRGDHYVSFDELYGVPTTERERPSLEVLKEEGHMAFHLVLITRLLPQCVLCAECLRPRVLHSKHNLSINDKIVVLERTVEYILFSCGSNFKDVKPLNYPGDSPKSSNEYL